VLYSGDMISRWILILVVGLGVVGVVLVGALYVYGRGEGWVEPVVVGWYQLAAHGWGAVIPNKINATMTVAPAGGSELQKYGLKYAFVDSMYYEGIWRWGVIRPTEWLIFQYRADDQDRWLVVPVRGSLGWVEGKEGKTQVVTPSEIDARLAPGTRVSLALLYRYNDVMSVESIRADLIEKRSAYQQKGREVVVWEMGAFPGRVYSDEYIQNILTENTILLLDDNDISLSSVGIIK